MLVCSYQTAQHYVSLNYFFFLLCRCRVYIFSYLDLRIFEIVRSAKFQLIKVPFQRVGGTILNYLLLGEK